MSNLLILLSTTLFLGTPVVRLIKADTHSVFYLTDTVSARSAWWIMVILLVYWYAGFILLICIVYAAFCLCQKSLTFLYDYQKFILGRFYWCLGIVGLYLCLTDFAYANLNWSSNSSANSLLQAVTSGKNHIEALVTKREVTEVTIGPGDAPVHNTSSPRVSFPSTESGVSEASKVSELSETARAIAQREELTLARRRHTIYRLLENDINRNPTRRPFDVYEQANQANAQLTTFNRCRDATVHRELLAKLKTRDAATTEAVFNGRIYGMTIGMTVGFVATTIAGTITLAWLTGSHMYRFMFGGKLFFSTWCAYGCRVWETRDWKICDLQKSTKPNHGTLWRIN